MSNSYKVTVLISFYNSSRFIEHKINNIKSQTIFDECEIVFINGGSQQNEDGYVSKFVDSHDNCVYLKSEKRITIYEAWNRGIAATSAPYICNSNADDVLAPNAVERLFQEIDGSNASVVFPDIYTTTIPNTKWGDIRGGYIKTSEKAVMGPFVMWKRDLHDNYGLFNPDLWVIGDSEWWSRLRTNKEKFTKVNEHLATYLVGNGMERQKAPDGEYYRVKDAKLLNMPRGSVEGW